MVGTSWEVTTHLTPGVITTLPGAEHLGEANSWSEDPNKQVTNVRRRVGGSQASLPKVACRVKHQEFCQSRALCKLFTTERKF